MKTFKQYHEEKQKGVDGKACWKGYARRGTKKKGDKTVDNCVKMTESSSGEQIDLGYNQDAIEDLLALLSQYGMREGKHFVSHVGYGDDLPNAITITDNVLKQLRPEQLEEIQATASASHDEDEWADQDFQGEYDEQLDEKNARCTKTTKKASSTSKGKKWMKCVKSDSGGYKRIHWGQKGAKVTGKSGNTKRKKSFRARHKCSTAKPGTPRHAACQDW